MTIAVDLGRKARKQTNKQTNKQAFFCLKIFLNFTNSVDPDEMQHFAAFHLGLHCLQKYSFSRLGVSLIQKVK